MSSLGGEAPTVPQGGEFAAETVMKHQRDRLAELRRAAEERAALLVELIEYIHGNEHTAHSWATCRNSLCREVQVRLPGHAQDAREADDYGDS